MDALNTRQREVVENADGAMAIIAGPGTGKTHTLAHRIAYLLNEKQVPAKKVLAITFTRSAAGAMRERVKQLAPASDDVWIDTFHAVALRLLKEDGYPSKTFSIISEEEKQAVLEGLLERLEGPVFLDALRLKKQKLIGPETSLEKAYQEKLLAQDQVDFDDLFIYSGNLKSNGKNHFRYILVDEFQDTSYAQYQFLKRLAGEHLCVIGDPDQAIYNFDGQSFRPFEQFVHDYPEHRLIPLSENYRSQSVILEAAKGVIAQNPTTLPRALQARLEKGFLVEVSPYRSERHEAEMVVRRIEGLLGGASYFTIDSQWAEKEQESYQYGLGDIAILYRFHAQARPLIEALARSGLPFRTYGKKDVREREALSMDETAAPVPGLHGDTIQLMTLHRAKGLEFPVVFIVGCEDGVLPASVLEKAFVQEERRLFYVGMTRAKRRLFLSYARDRFLFGKKLSAGPSPFLKDIEKELRLLQEAAPTRSIKTEPVQPTLF